MHDFPGIRDGPQGIAVKGQVAQTALYGQFVPRHDLSIGIQFQ